MAAGKFNIQKASGGAASITVADGTTNTDLVLPESGTVATTSNLVGFKNYIINGKFRVNQYARLPHIVQPSSVVYIDGNWRAANSGTGTLTISEDTITYSGTIYSAIKATATTAITLATDTRYFTFATAIEANNISEISNKDMTLSFIFECSRAGKYSISITKLDSITGVTQKSYITSFTATVGVNEVVIPIPKDSYQVLKSVNVGVGIQIGFVSNNASLISSTDGWTTGSKYMKSDALSWADTLGAYIKIADVNLEPGLIKTPSENRPYGLELSLCQRYYEKLTDFRYVTYMTVGNNAWISARFSVPKRVSPTMNTVSVTYINTTGISYYDTNIGHSNIVCNATAAGQVGFIATIEAIAEL